MLLAGVDRGRRDGNLVHLLSKLRRRRAGEAGTDTADCARRQQQPTDTAKLGAMLIANDQEAFRLDAFDLEPVSGPSGAVGFAIVFGNYALEPERTRLRKELIAVDFDRLR